MFISGKVGSYGTWREHTASWRAARDGTDDFLLVKYESLLKNTLPTIRKIANFVDVDADDERLRKVIAMSDADRMRALERAEGHLWAPIKKTDKSRLFVRNARSGSWRDEMPAKLADKIGSAWGEQMVELGYKI